MRLIEKTRQQIIAKSRMTQKGKDRFQKRLKCKLSTSVKSYNNIDMNKVFKDDIIDVVIGVVGETDTYNVEVSFGGIVYNIRESLKNGDPLDYRTIYRAVVKAANSENMYLRCNCPDAQYRMAYWQTKNDILQGEPENRPSDETNPTDSLGSGCKHELAVLNNFFWIKKVVAVITNYIKYLQKSDIQSYQNILYPILYGKKYSEETSEVAEEDNNDVTLNTSDVKETTKETDLEGMEDAERT